LKPVLCSLCLDPVPFEKIAKFYIKPGALVIDVTAGKRRIWRLVRERPFTVVFMDIEPEEGNTLVADLRHLPFRDHVADVIVFDPPFLGNVSSQGRKRAMWPKYFSSCELSYFLSLMEGINHEAYRVLKPDGFLICKLMDCVVDGRLYPAVAMCHDHLTNFEVHDVIVSLKIVPFIVAPKVRSLRRHYYWIVLRPRRGVMRWI